MITFRFQGGLGNQMFQYCVYRKLQMQGIEIQADIFYYNNPGVMPFILDKVFPNIEIKLSKNEKEHDLVVKNVNRRSTYKVIDYFKYMFYLDKQKYIYELTEGKFNKYALKVKKGYIEGFWQSEKYFSDIAQDIRKQFCFCEIKNQKVKEYIKLIDNSNSVSVHIRRGDYLLPCNNKMFGNICTLQYYLNAIKYMQSKVEDIRLVFFSDDIDWVKENIEILENTIFIEWDKNERYEDWYDMYLMSKCKHNIIANSSFSWWGAWLNPNENKIVVAPKKWINGKKMPDILLDKWITVKG